MDWATCAMYMLIYAEHTRQIQRVSQSVSTLLLRKVAAELTVSMLSRVYTTAASSFNSRLNTQRAISRGILYLWAAFEGIKGVLQSSMGYVNKAL